MIKAVTFICVLLALCVSTHALNSRARLTHTTRVAVERSGLEVEDPGDQKSRASSATINKKLGFAFVLDNGNDIETVHETKNAHKLAEESRKVGSREASEKQKARDSEYTSTMARLSKDQEEFSTKLTNDEEARKKAAEEAIKSGDEAAGEEKKKRETEFNTKAQEAEAKQQKVEQAEKAEAQKAESAAAEAAVKADIKAKGVIRRDAWRLEAGKVLVQGADIPFNGAYTYMFWIKPFGTTGPWSNIIHKGQENGNRNPAVWFYPGGLRLHIRSGVLGNTNHGCDPEEQLGLNAWTHVAFTHNNWGIRVYINGAERCSAAIGSPVSNTGPLYVADPWHEAARADIADLRMLPSAVPIDAIAAAVRDKAGVPS